MHVEAEVHTPGLQSPHNRRKSRRSRKKSIRLGSVYIKDTTDIETLLLNRSTQAFLGCNIGETVTVTSPWIYIKKEKILQHIELYGEASEFFKIKKQIRKFPRKKIMVGSQNFYSEIPVEFYVCTTLSAQERVEKFMKEKHELMLKRIADSLDRRIGKWISLGSEEQVRAEMVLYNRIPLEVDIASEFPVHKTQARFRLKLAEEIKNGYVELRQKRPSNVEFFSRKRIDRSTQVLGAKKSNTTQTQLRMTRRQATQPNPRTTFEMTLELHQDLKKFLETEINYISGILYENYYLKLFKDDYANLRTSTYSMVIQNPVDIKFYQDVINCHRYRVSCISWNAIISGIVAAAYSRNPLFSISKQRIFEEPDPTVEMKHLILIWFLKDNVRPKLYLHAKFEVTALSFCPYNENILIAGYKNGLFAVYDLTNRLTDHERLKYLSEREQRYHILISDMTSWIKRPLISNHVFPALTSNFQPGHTSAITSISWIPSNYYISEFGIFTECKAGEEHMQFVTISLEGNRILVWDLKMKLKSKITVKVFQKKGRLSVIPAALTKNISPFKKLQNLFIPVCSLLVNESYNHQNKNPLIKMIMHNEVLKYVAVNPSTLDNLDVMTDFNVINEDFDATMPRRIVFSTGFGVIQVAVWKGLTYKNRKMEECSIETLAAVHDGPILVCEINAYFPDMILTVGGSVFAIWDYVKTSKALVWRKSKNCYQSGMWCFHHPLSVLVIRTDRCYEFWDMGDMSNRPLQRFRYKGYEVERFFADSTRFHVRKKTFISTDTLGAFKVISLPSETVKHPDVSIRKARQVLERVFKFRRYINQVIQTWKEKNSKQPKPEELTHEPVDTPAVKRPWDNDTPKVLKASNEEKFQKKLHRHMKFVQLKRKKINLQEIHENRLICSEARKENVRLLPRPQENKLMEVCDKLFGNVVIANKVRRMFTVTLTREAAEALKKRYIESFQEIEQTVLNLIKTNLYEPNKNSSTISFEREGVIRKRHETLAHGELLQLEHKVIVETEVKIIKLTQYSSASLAY